MVKPVAEIADLIYELRQQLALTQEQFAARLGVTYPTINRWENRRAQPSPMALKLIHALHKQMGESGNDLLKRYFPDD